MRISQAGVLKTAVLAGGLALSAGPALTQTQGGNLPDAQIEANVLRQLASASELSSQNIQTSTVYGTVTLTGNVHDEAMRSKAENLTARAQGVKKVVDQLTLGDAPAAGDQGAQGGYPAGDNGAPAAQVLQSDGTYAPAPPDNGPQGAVPAPGQSGYPVQPGYSGAPEYGSGNRPIGVSPQQPYDNNGYAGQSAPPNGAYPQNQNQPYGDQQQAYGSAPPPPAPDGAPRRRQPMYPQGYAPYPQGGQAGGQVVTIAPGNVLQVRVDRGFDANHVQPGTTFTGVVMQDIFANGAIAIPRGAAVQGTVVDARKAGALKGRAELGLAINNLMLGGQNYPLATEVWEQEGRDKTVHTVNSALGLGALGAVLGGVAGGGSGAAIGAGVGGAAGVASSAGSPAGRVIVPAEAVLTFRLAQPATVTTVGQAELSRLSYAAGPGVRPAPVRRYYSPNGYYGPGYYR